MIYCIVPRSLAAKLYGTLERFYDDEASVAVVIEGRVAERRAGAERRHAGSPARHRIVDRRRVQHPDGRRVADRRAVTVPAIREPALPRHTRSYAAQLAFVVCLAGPPGRAEDVAVGRLVLRIQAGDAPAFEDLYKTYFDAVYSYLRLVLPNPDDIEYALQEIFSRVFTQLGDFDPGREPFRAWLGRVLFEHSSAELREAELLEPDDDGALPERWAGAHDLAVLEWLTDHDLLLLMSRLPSMQRDVMAYHYLFALSSLQIAAIVGRSPDEVDKLHGRALRFMAGCLTSLGRRPGYSGRHPMRAHVHPGRVARGRQLALRA